VSSSTVSLKASLGECPFLFGMKCHVGVDAESGVVHTAISTHAKEQGITKLPPLLHGEESEVIGDRGYCSEADREELEEQGVRLH
jgi:IS5 family transposase